MKKELNRMPNRVVSVNFEGVESGGGVRAPHVPEGDYALKCTKVETKKSKDEGNPYLLFHLKLIKGHKKGVGKTLPHSCSLQKQSLWNLRNLLESMGVQVPSKSVKIPLDKLVGKTCAGTVVDDEYNDREKSSFGAFFPLEELGKTSDKADELDDDEEEGTSEDEEEEEEKPRSKKKKKAGKKKEEEGEEETTEEEEEGGEDTEEELFS
jgi:nucleosome binding factor SPN SPT16 subunit